MCFKTYVRNGKHVNHEYATPSLTSKAGRTLSDMHVCLNILWLEKLNFYNGGIVHSVFDT